MFKKSKDKNSPRFNGTGVGSVCELLILVGICMFCLNQQVHASIVVSGDIDPADPATWELINTYAYIGKTGEGTLDITDGSVARSRTGFIGYEEGSSGEVLVDGTGSGWTNNLYLYVGSLGNGKLTITNGGIVTNNHEMGYIGFGSGSTGDVLVDGAGSIWNLSNNLYVGRSGHGTLNITNGGTVHSLTGFIGNSEGSVGEVTVDGVGSKWYVDNNSHYGNDTLYVGHRGSSKLNITNGGTVIVKGDTSVKNYNELTSEIHFNNGTFVTYGFLGSTDRLTGTGTINTYGLVTNIDLVFDATHGATQTFTINQNSNQNITVNLIADKKGALGAGGGGTMRIADGQVITSANGYVGYGKDTAGFVTVDGVGSKWEMNGGEYHSNISIGHGTLNVINGGEVNNHEYGYIGSLGVVTVDGAGSKWINWKDLSISGGSSSTLNITNGGLVRNREGIIGRGGTNDNTFGEVKVDGDGSLWTNRKKLTIGNYAHGKLTVTNGGAVSSQRTYLGYKSIDDMSDRVDAIKAYGEVMVDGVGSTWTNSDMLFVGYYGDGKLNITGGGQVISNAYCYIAYTAKSTGEVLVDGEGSTWMINGYQLDVGHNGPGLLKISNGGKVVVDGNTQVAWRSGGSGRIHFDNGTLVTNTLFSASDDLTGTGTINAHGLVGDMDLVFDATHGLTQTFQMNQNSGQDIVIQFDVDGSAMLGAGYKGAGSIRIADGVAVKSTHAYIGYNAGSSGEVIVDGAGSRWDSKSQFFIGYSGYGKMNIINGGAVSSLYDCYIGYQFASARGEGEVVVDGAGSMMTVGGDSFIVNGSLKITSGGKVRSHTGTVASEGVISVDGSDSIWEIEGGLSLSGQTELKITHGGQVRSRSSGIFGDSKVIVDGAESIWANNEKLLVKYQGLLTITDGGLVTAGSLSMGGYNDRDNYINMTTGGMLALNGDADESLTDFLRLIDGSGNIRYWENTLSDWAPITDGIADVDYSLAYFEQGDLAGYTVLTVYDAIIAYGDLNGDGLVDGFDVDPFVKTLLYGPYQVEADMNKDGVVDGFDTDPFVAMVLGGGVAPQGDEVPEPATLMLLGLGGLICARQQRNKKHSYMLNRGGNLK